MSAGMNNGNLLVDPVAALDSFAKFLQDGVNRATAGYQNSSSAFKISFGNLGTNDTVIIDATGGKYKGFNTNTAPASGFIGEQVRAAVASGSAIAMTHATITNITSITLSPGVWDLTAVLDVVATGANSANPGVIASISTANNTNGVLGDSAISGTMPSDATTVGTSIALSFIIPNFRVLTSGSPVYYLNCYTQATAGFGANAYGRISAVRVG